MSDFDEYEMIGTPKGMGMFLVHFELSNVGEAIEEATAMTNIEALDLSRAALAYCSLNPSRVLSAAFYDASIGAADDKAQQQGGKKAVQLQLQAGIERFPKPEGWNVHDAPELVPQALAAAARFNLPEAVTALTMPVLVATGDHDPNLASSRDLVDKALNARLEVLENVGQGSILQRPDLTAKTFMQFQESLGSLDSKEN